MGLPCKSLIFSPLNFQGRVIRGTWILDIVHDGLSILMTVNEIGTTNDRTVASTAVIPNCVGKGAMRLIES